MMAPGLSIVPMTCRTVPVAIYCVVKDIDHLICGRRFRELCEKPVVEVVHECGTEF